MIDRKAKTVAPIHKLGGAPTDELYRLALQVVAELAKRKAEESVVDDLHSGCFDWHDTMCVLQRVKKSMMRIQNELKDIVYSPMRKD